jgi:hypothetical protein
MQIVCSSAASASLKEDMSEFSSFDIQISNPQYGEGAGTDNISSCQAVEVEEVGESDLRRRNGLRKRRIASTGNERHAKRRYSSSESDEEWIQSNSILLSPKCLFSPQVRERRAVKDCSSTSSSSAEDESRHRKPGRRRKRLPTAFLDAETLVAPSFHRKRDTSAGYQREIQHRRLRPALETECQEIRLGSAAGEVSCTSSSADEEIRMTHRRRKRLPTVFLNAETLVAPSFHRNRDTTTWAGPQRLIRRRRLRPVSDSDELPQDTDQLQGTQSDAVLCSSISCTEWRPCPQRPETPTSGSDWDLCWPERQALGLGSTPSSPIAEASEDFVAGSEGAVITADLNQPACHRGVHVPPAMDKTTQDGLSICDAVDGCLRLKKTRHDKTATPSRLPIWDYRIALTTFSSVSSLSFS